ncbi:hypothetical protein [Paraburkholderia tropica]|uniref:hypothetical protein n=1 Tax=Paraburkholderia tropica TaxID=92647 RepID=UPI002AB729F2|nr:hypothetical protein [Paraburkholderia tropica]
MPDIDAMPFILLMSCIGMLSSPAANALRENQAAATALAAPDKKSLRFIAAFLVLDGAARRMSGPRIGSCAPRAACELRGCQAYNAWGERRSDDRRRQKRRVRDARAQAHGDEGRRMRACARGFEARGERRRAAVNTAAGHAATGVTMR